MSRSPRPSLWLGALLALALLALQAAGLAHRVAHAPQAVAVLAVLADTSVHAASAGFGHEDDASECRLFDQLTLADAADATAPAAALAPVSTASSGRVADLRPAPAWLARPARGPPTQA